MAFVLLLLSPMPLHISLVCENFILNNQIRSTKFLCLTMVMTDDVVLRFSYCFWGSMEIGTLESTNEVEVEKRDGMASISK